MKSNALPARPRLRPYYYAVALDDDRAQLRSAHRAVVLNGPGVTALVNRILPLLDGTRSVDRVATDSGFSVATVEHALRRLDERQLLEDAEAVSHAASILSDEEQREHEDQILLFSTLVTNPYKLQAGLRDASVAVVGHGDLALTTAQNLVGSGVGHLTVYTTHSEVRARQDRLVADIRQSLPNASIVSLSRPEGELELPFVKRMAIGHDLVVVCNDGPSRQLCHAVNEAALEQEQTWLPVTLFGNDAAVGPLIVPGQTACFRCYEARIAANLVFSDEHVAFQDYVTRGPHRDRRQGAMRPYGSIAAGLATIEAVKFLTKVSYPTTLGRLLTINFLSYQIMVQSVLRLPRCSACGAVAPVHKEWQM